MKELINHLKEIGVLKSKRIEEALLAVDRADFVPQEARDLAYKDTALPIGYGQTISQPYTVVFMLELLNVQEGDVMMEAGFGSGWQTALLSYLVGSKGKVYSFEIVEELCKFGQLNLEKYQDLGSRIELFCQSATDGINKIKNLIDRIIVAADIPEIPKIWRERLRVGGVLLYPSETSIFREIKKDHGQFEIEDFPGFVFVPYLA
jgi:protein-L-isoaspartate(D-aspartate) O-methyltransferase